MPQTVFSSTGRNIWFLQDVVPLSASAPTEDRVTYRYEFAYWYPVFTLTNIPINTSQAVRSYGNKYYLGEIALINFGAVVETIYLNYSQQQIKPLLCLPQRVFGVGDADSWFGNTVSASQFFSAVPRVEAIAWNLEPNVEFICDVFWLKGRATYRADDTTVFQII